MKRIKLLLFILLFIFIPNIVYATNLDSMDINVKLQENGDGLFTVTKEYEDDKDTEHYIEIHGKNEYSIENVEVTRNNIPMEFVNDWNSDWSLKEKAGKFGIIETENGYEICYGITEYGKNDFQLKYTMTNFIKQAEDAQFFKFDFLNKNSLELPNKLDISIEMDNVKFNKENIKVWGFGFPGKIGYKNGKITGLNIEKLDSDNHVVIMVEFKENFFTITKNTDKTFSEIKEDTLKNSDYNSNNDDLFSMKKILTIAGIVLAIGAMILLYFYKRARSSEFLGVPVNKIDIKKTDFKNEYCSEFPYKGKLEDLYFVIYYNWGSPLQNYMSAYFIKWIQNGKILIDEEENNIEIIDLEYSSKDYFENKLYKWLIYSSIGEGVISTDDFIKYIEENEDELDDLLLDIKDNSKEKLIELGYLDIKTEIRIFSKYIVTVFTDKGKDLAEKLIKYENYLKNYLEINRDEESQYIKDEDIVFACILGLIEEFEDIKDENFNIPYISYGSFFLIHQITADISNTYSNVDSSGGGFTSIGGGGDSFGGGMGGGTR